MKSLRQVWAATQRIPFTHKEGAAACQPILHMKKRFAHLKQLLFYGGLEKEKYRAIAADIDESNRSSLVVISFAYVMIYLTRLLVSYDTIPYTSRILFISAIAFFGAIALVSCLTKGKRRFIHLSAYVFLAGYLGIGIFSAVGEGNIQERTTLYLVYVSAAPMLFALNAVELTAIIVPAELLYLFMITRYQSMYPVYAANCSNSFYFSIMGLLLGIYMSNMKIWGVYNAHMNSRMGEIERLNRELHQSREDLQEALFSAEQANRSKTIFLNNMSHDIRTPMNAIIGFTALAQKHIDNREQVENYLQKISVSSQHLLSLINDVLDMSKVESGTMQMLDNPFDLRVLLDNCCAIVEGQIAEHNLTFTKQIGPFWHPYLRGSELHIRQVLINILSNAVKYTPDGGTITFRARETLCEEGLVHLRMEIADNGIGMSEEFLQHIFEPFTQEAHGSRTTYKGTGLGMAITKKLVDQMHGSLDVESEPGRGSTFTVRLSLPLGNYVPKETVPQKGEGPEDLQGLHLLLAEDNELNREIAVALLQEQGAEITAAVNGREAVEAVKNAPPGAFDAVLMDVMMPEMNGLDATRAIREWQGKPKEDGIPIIAMTANVFADDVKACLDAGMNSHVGKPLNMKLLVAEILRLTRK